MSLTKNKRKDTVGTCALLGNLEVTSCENDLSPSDTRPRYLRSSPDSYILRRISPPSWKTLALESRSIPTRIVFAIPLLIVPTLYPAGIIVDNIPLIIKRLRDMTDACIAFVFNVKSSMANCDSYYEKNIQTHVQLAL